MDRGSHQAQPLVCIELRGVYCVRYRCVACCGDLIAYLQGNNYLVMTEDLRGPEKQGAVLGKVHTTDRIDAVMIGPCCSMPRGACA